MLYFDSFLIGLTATPAGKTIGFFNQNLVMQYGHAEAVTDGVNVGFDVYRIRTRITGRGAKLVAGETGIYVDRRHRLTRAERLERLTQDLTYTANQLDRDVVSESQIRTVIRQFRDGTLPQAFPGRAEVPKTLIFAKDDSHADDIVRIVREEFGERNEFCEKITYRTGFTRVTNRVTNDDGKCVFFLRNVKSAGFFEQMKGRGVRVISPDKLRTVSPSARVKDRFIVVDAVGVSEQDRTESYTLNRKPSASLEEVLNYVAQGGTDPDALTTLAGRLARPNRPTSRRAGSRSTAASAAHMRCSVNQASVLKAAVEGALTAEWRAEHPDVAPASELLLRILNERRRRWEEDQLAKFKAKGQPPPRTGRRNTWSQPRLIRALCPRCQTGGAGRTLSRSVPSLPRAPRHQG